MGVGVACEGGGGVGHCDGLGWGLGTDWGVVRLRSERRTETPRHRRCHGGAELVSKRKLTAGARVRKGLGYTCHCADELGSGHVPRSA